MVIIKHQWDQFPCFPLLITLGYSHQLPCQKNNPKWASQMAQLVENLPAIQETLVRFLGQEDHWRRERLPTPVFLGFPCDSAGKESACNTGDPGSIPGLGGSPGEGRGYPLQYSGLENFMGCIVYWIAKSWTRLSDFRRRQWHPTPVLLPGKSHEWRSLESCSPWGR